jgi:hypothetical protein
VRGHLSLGHEFWRKLHLSFSFRTKIAEARSVEESKFQEAEEPKHLRPKEILDRHIKNETHGERSGIPGESTPRKHVGEF